MIDYHHYRLTNRAAYKHQDADLSLHRAKSKVDPLYPTLQPFYGKDTMEILGSLSTMTKDFDSQRVSKGFATYNLGFFLTGSAQTAYNNVVYHGTHDPNLLPVTWMLVMHSLLNFFITDDLLRNEHNTVNSAQIK